MAAFVVGTATIEGRVMRLVDSGVGTAEPRFKLELSSGPDAMGVMYWIPSGVLDPIGFSTILEALGVA